MMIEARCPRLLGRKTGSPSRTWRISRSLTPCLAASSAFQSSIWRSKIRTRTTVNLGTLYRDLGEASNGSSPDEPTLDDHVRW